MSSTTSPPPTTPPQTTKSPATTAVVAVLAFSGIVVSLMQTLVIPIIPHLPEYLNAPASDTAWAVTATLLAAAVAVPTMGRLGDMFGKRRLLLISMALLVTGSVVGALSSSVIPPRCRPNPARPCCRRHSAGYQCDARCTSAQEARRRCCDDERFAGSRWRSGGASDRGFDRRVRRLARPVLGVSVLGALAAVLVVVLVPRIGGSHRWHVRLRWGGNLALSRPHRSTTGHFQGWRLGGLDEHAHAFLVRRRDPDIRILGLVGTTHPPKPLVDLRVSIRRQVLFTNLASIVFGFAMFAASMVFPPQVVQLPEVTGYGLGGSMLTAGLVMAPSGIIMMLISPLSSRITNSHGPKVTLMLGAVVVAIGYGIGIFAMHSIWELIVIAVIIGAGTGMAYGAMPALIMGLFLRPRPVQPTASTP